MLLDIQELGDSKLSEVMDKMLALLGDHRPCFLFRYIFLRLLPEAIRAPLANSSNNSDYRPLAKEADNLYNSLTPNSPVCTVLQDLDCAFVYLDDILVASSSAQSHIDDLNAVFHRLRHH
ncbi:hypothetical protein PoB_004729100 [Plakobranchus ocellatus]|uniref:Reverse transcriptase domain-containing protein n=1 Tax=Plakobranchus ocellatus TaxID=259542 RepID=A0AAV4BBQ9_9GAST|nr:hypothetical protein PoB_004729100 [Plakobranchus ocellatus]